MAAVSLLTPILWLTFLDFPRFVAWPNGDESWQQALAHFFKHRMQAGVDYVFTYGPLGSFTTHAYDGDLFEQRFAWELLVKSLMALAAVAVGLRIPSRILQGVFFLTLLSLPDHPDILYSFFVVLLVLVPLAATDRTSVVALPCTAVLGVLSLGKFTLLLLATLGVVTLTLWLAAQGRRGVAALVVPCYLAALGIAWLLAGQSLLNLPRYLDGALESSGGYSAAMGLEAPSGVVGQGLIAVLLLLAAVALSGAASRFQTLVLLGFAGAVLFLQWKQAFVRHGRDALNFFAFVTLFALVLPAVLTSAGSARRALLLCGGVAMLALVGRFAHDPLVLPLGDPLGKRLGRIRTASEIVTAPQSYQERMATQRRELQKAWALPRVRAVVGDAAIDVISYQQGVLFLNDLHYRPRPVFQSYAAYTPELLAMNAQFYESDHAPDYVLVRLAPIDDRIPASEDGPTLLQVLRRYRPVLEEKSFLLLKRVPKSEAGSTTTVVLERTIRIGEELRLDNLPPGRQTISIQVRYSGGGRMLKWLYRPSPLHLQVSLDEGDRRAYRLIPALVESEFLLNPFLENTHDLAESYGKPAGKRLTSVRMIAQRPADYMEEIGVVIRSR